MASRVLLTAGGLQAMRGGERLAAGCCNGVHAAAVIPRTHFLGGWTRTKAWCAGQTSGQQTADAGLRAATTKQRPPVAASLTQRQLAGGSKAQPRRQACRCKLLKPSNSLVAVERGPPGLPGADDRGRADQHRQDRKERAGGEGSHGWYLGAKDQGGSVSGGRNSGYWWRAAGGTCGAQTADARSCVAAHLMGVAGHRVAQWR